MCLKNVKNLVCLYAQLVVKVRPGLPHTELDSILKEKIKTAVVKHYNANVKALDLSHFQTHPGERMVICMQNNQVINLSCLLHSFR
jgi:hypothetical protein